MSPIFKEIPNTKANNTEIPHMEHIPIIVGNFTSPDAFMEPIITILVVLPISRKTLMSMIVCPSVMTSGLSENNLSVKLLKRSEEHTSELQSRFDLVCRLLLEKKKKHQPI